MSGAPSRSVKTVVGGRATETRVIEAMDLHLPGSCRHRRGGAGADPRPRIYVEGKLSPAEALATARVIPSQVFRFADERGSIAIGKMSDLIFVDGDPSRRIGDLRRVGMVLFGDWLMKGDELRKAAGLSGMPK